eukprot:TRINITY_DN80887_c0_g1_i1.p1 TRINITY_DN80887_c0_g1~~TRINITY_DN80887_c0_g1_i1.p1  ORF type:complete len:121 (-),score=7.66 TRINITY_DN80887_c0_g1_i1:392-754(-)
MHEILTVYGIVAGASQRVLQAPDEDWRIPTVLRSFGGVVGKGDNIAALRCSTGTGCSGGPVVNRASQLVGVVIGTYWPRSLTNQVRDAIRHDAATLWQLANGGLPPDLNDQLSTRVGRRA